MRKAALAVAVFASSGAQAQPGPCYWAGQLFTCNAPSENKANADVFVAQGVTGPASSFTSDFSPEALRTYSSGVHDAMVNKNPEHLVPAAVTVSTEVMTIGSHKVLKTRVYAPSQMFMYQFAGVSGPDMVVVGCISRTAHPFEIRGTECQRQVATTFGR
jgi:hypothetical protein